MALYKSYAVASVTMNDIDTAVILNTTDEIRRTRIPVYVCPSDGKADMITSPRAPHNYSGSQGASLLGVSNGTGNPACPCPYPFNAFVISPGSLTGPFTRYGSPSTLNDVPDGLSKVLFFGEVVPECSNHVAEGWGTTNNAQGMTNTTVPINYNTCKPGAPGASNCDKACNWNTEFGFRSRHAGGAHFTYGDGSVHYLSETIDMTLYSRLGARADGKIIEGLEQ
jgi:prepilin-type processing-associated H-X9-DG protein